MPVRLSPAAAAGPAADRLEKGAVLRWPRSPLPLPDAHDLEFLRRACGPHGLEYLPGADVVRGCPTGPAAARARRLLREHARRVELFVGREAPAVARGWTLVDCVLRVPRPDEAVPGLDVLPTPTHGDRLFRFFANVDAARASQWSVHSGLPELLNAHAEASGLTRPRFGRGLREGAAARALARGVGALRRMGLPMNRALDDSPYDQALVRFAGHLRSDPRLCGLERERLELPPGAAWCLLSDAVCRAWRGGALTLIATYLAPLRNCRYRSLTPFNLIEQRLRG